MYNCTFIEIPEEHYAYNLIKNMTADAPEDRMPLSQVIDELSNQVSLQK